MTHYSQLPPIRGSTVQQIGKRPLRVLTITPFYPTEADPASGCFVAESLNALAELGIESSVFAVQPFYRGRPRAPHGDRRASWMRYLSLPGNKGLPMAGAFVFARVVGKVRTLQQSQPVDLIHAHAALPCGHAAMLLSSELAIPYVVSVHGLDAFSTEQVGGRAGLWSKRISQRVYQSSRRAICVSERVREEVLGGTAGKCRTSVVYNGVDARLFSPGDATSPKRIVLSVGNLIAIKGHDVLIRAIGLLRNEYPALELEIIGDGPELSRLQALVGQLQLDARVRFLGRQSRSEVARTMRECTLFALPSRYEGLGCVYLEAMSTGKPVIGCRGQGIAEIIQHGSNGFLVGPDNEKELAVALGMLLRDENRRRNLGRAARDTVVDGLTLSHQAERLARIYRECVA